MPIKYTLGIVFLISLVSCSEDERDFALQGSWINTASTALSFIEFYSESQGRMGIYVNNFQQYDSFNYHIVEKYIAIDFVGDNEPETFYRFSLIDKNKLVISGLTDIPENPDITFQRYNIITEKVNNQIILGKDDLYYDFGLGYSLRGYCFNESRCPTGVYCITAGYAAARLDLNIGSSSYHSFDLYTADQGPGYRSDTTISGLTIKLLDITPYPVKNKDISPQDYRLILSVE